MSTGSISTAPLTSPPLKEMAMTEYERRLFYQELEVNIARNRQKAINNILLLILKLIMIVILLGPLIARIIR